MIFAARIALCLFVVCAFLPGEVWIGPSCATAQEALDLFAKVIASLGSIEGDIYMIADRREAWYLEIYTGHHWAAVRMPEDMVMTQGNEFMIDDVDPASPDSVSTK